MSAGGDRPIKFEYPAAFTMMISMGKKMSKAGIVLRRAIRAELEANPSINHLKIRSKYKVGEPVVESAMVKNVAEWDALIGATPDDVPASIKQKPLRDTASTPDSSPEMIVGTSPSITGAAVMPGIEQGVIKFTRKPAKMGTDYIFWIPRVYLKNGLVDPRAEYEVFLKKK